MTPTETDAARDTGWALPRRDLLILPLLSLLTVVVLLGGAELLARRLFADGPADACLLHDPALGVRYRPNCVSQVKVPESPWVTNSFNACGYRSASSCAPVPAGTSRIALIGSSMALGLYVPYAQSIGAQLGTLLTAACHRPVQVQNLASEYEFWHVLGRRFPAALALQPTAVLVLAGPTDIETQDPELSADQNALPPMDLMTRLRNVFTDVRLRVVAQHYLYRNGDFYLSLYRSSVAKTLSMRAPLAQVLQTHLQAYGKLLAPLAAGADGRKVPVLLGYLPARAQVGFVNDPKRPATIDPTVLPRALASMAASDGIAFADTTPAMAADPAGMDLFLRSDGHMAAGGDQVAAASLARAIVAQLPPFHDCTSGAAPPSE